MRALLALVLLAGCAVDDSFLDTSLFPCAAASDCGQDWGCQRASPYASNFCAPRCDATNCENGICSGDEVPLCLNACMIAEDGTPSDCQSEGFACIRTSIERDDGVCYPVRSCATSEQCDDGEVCLTEEIGLEVGESVPVDNLYCVPRVGEEGACPPGSSSGIGNPGMSDLCLPSCTVSDTRCPPGFACLTQLQQLAPLVEGLSGPVCTIGSYGLSCQNDTNCFVGRCEDTGTAQGKICTITCNEASRRAGGCENLMSPYSLNGLLYRMQCDEDAESSDDSGLCVVRYNVNFPGCTLAQGSAYECASGLECLQVEFSDGTTLLCTRDCATNEDCNAELTGPELYECARTQSEGRGICLLK